MYFPDVEGSFEFWLLLSFCSAKGSNFLFVPQRAPTFFFSAKKKVAKKKLSAAFLTGQLMAALL